MQRQIYPTKGKAGHLIYQTLGINDWGQEDGFPLSFQYRP